MRVGDDAVAIGETPAASGGLPRPSHDLCDSPWRSTLARGRVVVCSLAEDERSVHDAVPITSVWRTLADLAAADPNRAKTPSRTRGARAFSPDVVDSSLRPLPITGRS